MLSRFSRGSSSRHNQSPPVSSGTPFAPLVSPAPHPLPPPKPYPLVFPPPPNQSHSPRVLMTKFSKVRPSCVPRLPSGLASSLPACPHRLAFPPPPHSRLCILDTCSRWDLNSGSLLRTLRGHPDSVDAVAVTPDGKWAISGGLNDDRLRVWDLQTGESVRSYHGLGQSYGAVVITPDGRRLVAASSDPWNALIEVWDLGSGNKLRPSEAGTRNSITDLVLATNGREAVSSSSDHTLKVWNLDSGDLVAPFRPMEVSWRSRLCRTGRRSSLRRNPDGSTSCGCNASCVWRHLERLVTFLIAAATRGVGAKKNLAKVFNRRRRGGDRRDEEGYLFDRLDEFNVWHWPATCTTAWASTMRACRSFYL